MINQNIKNQVQNRINSVDGATSLRDLLLLQRSAQGMNCDDANLRTQIAAKLNAMDGATPVLDVVMGSKATGLADDTVLYSAPFAVSAGDDIYIDVLGKLKKQQHPIAMAVKTDGVSSNVGLSSIWRTYLNTLKSGSFNNSNDREAFCYTLQDGNLMVGFATGASPSSGGLFQLFVLSPLDMSVLSYQAVAITYGTASVSYFRGIGLREISANVFRYYFVAAPSGGTNSVAITFNTITYNPTTKDVSSAAGTTIQTSPAGSFAAVSCIQGNRYVLLATSIYTYCLDMQNGTVNTYGGISGTVGLNQVLQFDVDSVGNEYAVVLAGTTPKLLKAGVDSVLDVPANLSADGCFGSDWIKTRIGAGAYLARNQTAKVLKLVKFNANYTSCSIYTLSSNFDAISSNTTGEAVFKRGNTHWFAPNNIVKSVVAFDWDGTNAPTGFRTSDNVDVWDVRHLGERGRTVVTADNTMVNIGGFASSNNGTIITYGAFVQLCDPAESFTTRATKIGVALTDAAANGLFELRLNNDSTFISANEASDLSRIKHSGLITKFEKCRPHRIKTAISTSASLSYSNIFSATDYGEMEETSGRDIVGFGTGALVVNAADVETTWRINASEELGGFSAFQLNGRKADSSSSSNIIVARINAPKPVVVTTYNTTTLTSEVPV